MSSCRPCILLFAPECYPPAGAESIVTAKLVLAALAEGWEIDIICQARAGQYYPAETEGIWAPLRDLVHPIDTALSCIPKEMHSFNWIMQSFAKGYSLLKRRNYDFIFSRTMPQYGHLPALLLSRMCKIPWIASWSDPLPRQKAPPPYGKGSNVPMPHVMGNYVRAAARYATWHIFPSERLLTYVSTYLPGCSERSSVIPHIALDGLSLSTEPLKACFTLCHVGGLGIRRPDVFLEGIKFFLSAHSEFRRSFKTCFVGPYEKTLTEKVISFSLDDVVALREPMTYEVSLKTIAESSVAVVIEAPCEEGIFFPSKVADFIQTGRPILAVSPKVGTLSDLLCSHGGGIAADCTSPEAVSHAIETLFHAWRAGNLQRDFGSDRLREMFSPSLAIAAYGTIIKEMKAQWMHATK